MPSCRSRPIFPSCAAQELFETANCSAFAQQLFDLSGDLVGLADRDEEFKLPVGRGDEVARGGGPEPRDRPKPVVAARDLFVPDLHIDTLKIEARNFQ
ncbi:hypothetical protein HFO04_33490 [Rhizobium laguerreae]|nr:hypothetical protein [Rhizobium laguerreae]